MAKDKNQELMAALAGASQQEGSSAGFGKNKELEERVKKEENSKLPRKTVVIIGIAALVAGLLVGAPIGCTVGGGSGGDSVDNLETVSSVKEHVAVYDTLESMREDRVESLTKQLALYPANSSSSSSTSLSRDLTDYMTQTSTIMASYSEKTNAFFSALIESGLKCDFIQRTADAPENASKENESDAAKATVVLMSGAEILQASPDGNTLLAKMQGSSPMQQVGAPCKAVSAPIVSWYGFSDQTDDGTGNQTLTQMVLVYDIPISTDAGKLYTARYVVRQGVNGALGFIGYCGVTDEAGTVGFGQALATAYGK